MFIEVSLSHIFFFIPAHVAEAPLDLGAVQVEEERDREGQSRAYRCREKTRCQNRKLQSTFLSLFGLKPQQLFVTSLNLKSDFLF